MNAAEELGRLLDEAGIAPCFWFGKDPCPICGGDHGNRGVSDERDRELFATLEAEAKRRHDKGQPVRWVGRP